MTTEQLLEKMRASLSRMEARGHAETRWYAELLAKYLLVRAGCKWAINPVAHNLIADVGAMIPRTNRRTSDGQVIALRASARKRPVEK